MLELPGHVTSHDALANTPLITRTLWGSQAPSRACHGDTPSAQLLPHEDSWATAESAARPAVHTEPPQRPQPVPGSTAQNLHTQADRRLKVQGMSHLAVAPSKPAGQRLSPVQPEAGQGCAAASSAVTRRTAQPRQLSGNPGPWASHGHLSSELSELFRGSQDTRCQHRAVSSVPPHPPV